MNSPKAENSGRRHGSAPVRMAAVVLAVSVLAALALQICLMQDGRDQSIYAVVAEVMLDGGAPYRDAWDFKPPGVFFAYALARGVLGSSMHAARILEALMLLSMVGAFMLLARRLFGYWMIGLLAGVVALLYHAEMGFWDTAQPESFAAPLIVWAIFLAMTSIEGDGGRNRWLRWGAWAGCAALFTSAALLKPPLGGGILFAFGVIAVREWRLSRMPGLVPVILSFTVGGIVVLGANAGYLVAMGAWADFRYIFFEYVPNYTAIGATDRGFLSQLLKVFGRWPATGHPFVWVGVLLALVPRSLDARQKELLVLILGALAAQVVGIALQSKFFAYHYGGVLPLAAFLAVWGYARLWRMGRARWALVIVVAAGIHYGVGRSELIDQSRLRVQALFDATSSQRINDALHTIHDVDAKANRVASEWIARNTPEDQPIYVWGFEPAIYDRSNRKPASRYIYNVAQRSSWGRDEARAELMRELAASVPSAIVTVRNDPFGHVVGNNRDSAEELQNFPELRELINGRYRRSAVAGDLEIYVRTDLLDGVATQGGDGPAMRRVLLLTVDTLRPDFLGHQGYPLPTTPAIDSLYASSSVFTQSVTPVPRTTQALASLLTGRYPHGTGVRTLVDRLKPDAVSLAEIAAVNGYTTLAVVSNHILTRERGLDRGFMVYDFADDTRSAAETTAAVKRALAGYGGDDAVFLWVHYIDPHVPYYPRRETIEKFSPDYEGRYRDHFGQTQGGIGNAAYPEDLPKHLAVYQNTLPDDINAHIRRLYAADVRDTDDAIADLLAWLRANLGDDWMVVFASDHGESLGEHDFFYDHGDYVYEATSRVPLSFTFPAAHPMHGERTIGERVSLIDVAPTLVDVLGWRVDPAIASRFEGRSLSPYLRGESLPSRVLFAECGRSYYPDLIKRRVQFNVAGRFRAVWKDEWKLIWTPFQQGDLEFELYDLSRDPNETHDVSAEYPRKVAELQRLIDAWVGAHEDSRADRKLTDEEVKRLKSLGYIGD